MGLLGLWLKPPHIAPGCTGPNPEIPLAWYWGLVAGLLFQVGQWGVIAPWGLITFLVTNPSWAPHFHLPRRGYCYTSDYNDTRYDCSHFFCVTEYDKGFSWRTFTFKAVT